VNDKGENSHQFSLLAIHIELHNFLNQSDLSPYYGIQVMVVA
jgi:hypothetical protein